MSTIEDKITRVFEICEIGISESNETVLKRALEIIDTMDQKYISREKKLLIMKIKKKLLDIKDTKEHEILRLKQLEEEKKKLPAILLNLKQLLYIYKRSHNLPIDSSSGGSSVGLFLVGEEDQGLGLEEDGKKGKIQKKNLPPRTNIQGQNQIRNVDDFKLITQFETLLKQIDHSDDYEFLISHPEQIYYNSQLVLLDLYHNTRQSLLAPIVEILKQNILSHNHILVKESLQQLYTIFSRYKTLFAKRKLSNDINILIGQANEIVAQMDQHVVETCQNFFHEALKYKTKELLIKALMYYDTKLNTQQQHDDIDHNLLIKIKKKLKFIEAQELIKKMLNDAYDSNDYEILENALEKAYDVKLNIYDCIEMKKVKFLILKKRRQKKFQKSHKKLGFNMKGTSKIFGCKLENIQYLNEIYQIPQIVYYLIEYLKSDIQFLKSPGIFRVPGDFKQISILKNKLIQFISNTNKNNKVSHVIDIKNMLRNYDINTIAGLLKLYFREMLEPLIPYKYYTKWLNTIGRNEYEFMNHNDDKTNNAKEINKLMKLYNTQIAQQIKLLPLEYYSLFMYLFDYLRQLADYSQYNLMVANNLAIVFTPNILRPKVETSDSMITQMSIATCLITSIIHRFNQIRRLL